MCRSWIAQTPGQVREVNVSDPSPDRCRAGQPWSVNAQGIAQQVPGFRRRWRGTTSRLTAGSIQLRAMGLKTIAAPASTTPSWSNGGVARHVQERAANVEVVVTAAQEEQRGRGVDHDPDRRMTSITSLPATGLRIGEAVDCFQRDGAGGDEQENRVEQSGEDRGTAQAVGAAAGGRAAREHRGAPGDGEAEHVAEIVSGIRDQRHGMADHARRGAHDDEAKIQHDTHRERRAEIGGGVGVAVVIVRVGRGCACGRSRRSGFLYPPLEGGSKFASVAKRISGRGQGHRHLSMTPSRKMPCIFRPSLKGRVWERR